MLLVGRRREKNWKIWCRKDPVAGPGSSTARMSNALPCKYYFTLSFAQALLCFAPAWRVKRLKVNMHVLREIVERGKTDG